MSVENRPPEASVLPIRRWFEQPPTQTKRLNLPWDATEISIEEHAGYVYAYYYVPHSPKRWNGHVSIPWGYEFYDSDSEFKAGKKDGAYFEITFTFKRKNNS